MSVEFIAEPKFKVNPSLMLRLPELEYECSETTRVSFSSKGARLLGSRGKFEREVASLWDKIESIGSWPK